MTSVVESSLRRAKDPQNLGSIMRLSHQWDFSFLSKILIWWCPATLTYRLMAQTDGGIPSWVFMCLSESELKIVYQRETNRAREKELEIECYQQKHCPLTEWHTISSFPDTDPSLFVPWGQTSSNRGDGSGGGDGSQSREESLDGGIEGQKEGEGRDSDLHRLMKRGKRASFCLTGCTSLWEKRKGKGLEVVCECEHVSHRKKRIKGGIFTAGFARLPCICGYGSPMKRVCVYCCMEEEFANTSSPTCVSMCMYMRVTLCCFMCVSVCVMHLQTAGTRAPVHAEGEVQAADWPPLQTTLLCATPGCPQYLKTESINRVMM